MDDFHRENLLNSKIIVIKIGSSSLLDKNDNLSSIKFEKIASESAKVLSLNKKVVIVSSGAIAAGKEKLQTKKLNSIQEKQAAAAIGQGILMKEFDKAFSKFGLITAQVLLTRDVINNRTRYLNAKNTIDQIIKFGAVPIINENDTISDEEIKFGDNDTLSAIVSNLIGADLLIILSDVEGFIINGKVIDTIPKITSEIEKNAKGTSSTKGTGGMITKLSAAKMAISSGIPVVIAGFFVEDVIKRIISGENIGTLFIPLKSKIEGKKRWLIGNKKVMGKIVVDDGAKKALIEKGKSLLPVGIKQVFGDFNRGDVVSLTDTSGKEFAKGISNYSSKDIQIIKGKTTKEAAKLLNFITCDEIIHRNNMVIL